MIWFIYFTLRVSFRFMSLLLVIFILPALLHLGVWTVSDRPASWRSANWSSAGVLPQNPDRDKAEIYVLTARTGGLKGAFATHSWLVLKHPGVINYDRYDVVGWGTPLRKNAYDADAHWYSNAPEITHHISGIDAANLLPHVEEAISNYRWRERGDYNTWPGPNSNTFVASIIRQVPDLETATPTTGVGRDFPADGRWVGQLNSGAYFATIGGYLGFVVGGNNGIELNFLGLVAGFNPGKDQILIPAIGAFNYGKLLS